MHYVGLTTRVQQAPGAEIGGLLEEVSQPVRGEKREIRVALYFGSRRGTTRPTSETRPGHFPKDMVLRSLKWVRDFAEVRI